MFCKYCGKPMEAWESEWGHVVKDYCQECYPKYHRYSQKKPMQFYCVLCGTPIPKRLNPFGFMVYTGDKYCATHKPEPGKISPIVNRRTSLAWQKNNPEKVKASVFAKTHPYEVYVLYECRCDHPKKHNHHFNYELKNIVIRLCPACHAAEHKRLRSLASPALMAVNG